MYQSHVLIHAKIHSNPNAIIINAPPISAIPFESDLKPKSMSKKPIITIIPTTMNNPHPFMNLFQFVITHPNLLSLDFLKKLLENSRHPPIQYYFLSPVNSIEPIPYSITRIPQNQKIEQYKNKMQKTKDFKDKFQIFKEKPSSDYKLIEIFNRLKVLESKNNLENKSSNLEVKCFSLVGLFLGVLCVFIGLCGLVPAVFLAIFGYGVAGIGFSRVGFLFLSLGIITGIIAISFIVGGTVLIF